jgi:hypothetical protein
VYSGRGAKTPHIQYRCDFRCAIFMRSTHFKLFLLLPHYVLSQASACLSDRRGSCRSRSSKCIAVFVYSHLTTNPEHFIYRIVTTTKGRFICLLMYSSCLLTALSSLFCCYPTVILVVADIVPAVFTSPITSRLIHGLTQSLRANCCVYSPYPLSTAYMWGVFACGCMLTFVVRSPRRPLQLSA